MARVKDTTGTTPAPAKKAPPAKRAAPPEASRSAQRTPPPADGNLGLDQFMAGLRQVENGGSYDWRPNRVGARGAYQFMDYPAWAQEAGVDPNDHSPAAQDQVARHKIEQYLKAYNGDWSMVAAAWLGGPGGAAKWASGTADPSDGNMTTSQYVNAVLSAAGAPAQGGHIGGRFSAPVPGAGTTGGTTSAQDFTDPQRTVNQYLSDPQIAQQFGYLAGFLNDPTIGPILRRAAEKGYDPQTLFNEISKTPWWQHSTTVSRYWQGVRQTDPGSWNAAVTNAYQQVYDAAQQMGLRGATPADYKRMAAAAINSGYTDEQGNLSGAGAQTWLNTSLASLWAHYNPQADYTGSIGTTVAAMKQAAGNYLVPLSDQTVHDWAQHIVSGQQTLDDFTTYLRNQARGIIPTQDFADAIDRGQTTQQYLDPYAQTAAKVLQINPSSIDWTQPKWSAAYQTVDPSSGTKRPLSINEWQTKLMTDPTYGYDHLPSTVADAANLGQSLLQMFGYDGSGSAALSVG